MRCVAYIPKALWCHVMWCRLTWRGSLSCRLLEHNDILHALIWLSVIGCTDLLFDLMWSHRMWDKKGNEVTSRHISVGLICSLVASFYTDSLLVWCDPRLCSLMPFLVCVVSVKMCPMLIDVDGVIRCNTIWCAEMYGASSCLSYCIHSKCRILPRVTLSTYCLPYTHMVRPSYIFSQ